MAHQQNQNGFTWKKKKQIACTTVQYRQGCDQRGCRKHVNTKHSWFFFFDDKPDVSSTKELADDDTSGEITKQTARVLPSFSVSSQICELFTKWMTGSGGGCKKDRTAQQIVKRCLKFIKF